MKKMTPILIVLTVFLLVFVLNSGCEEVQNQPDVRKSKLIADENLRLTKELQQLKRQLDEEIKMLEGCRQEQVMFEKELDDVTTLLMRELNECKEKSLRLEEENEKLKAKIEQP